MTDGFETFTHTTSVVPIMSKDIALSCVTNLHYIDNLLHSRVFFWDTRYPSLFSLPLNTMDHVINFIHFYQNCLQNDLTFRLNKEMKISQCSIAEGNFSIWFPKKKWHCELHEYIKKLRNIVSFNWIEGNFCHNILKWITHSARIFVHMQQGSHFDLNV